MSKGILYIATGDQYLKEAKTSAKSVRTHMPEIKICLITDDPIESDLFDIIQSADELITDFSSSNLRPSMSPFDRTVFLDTDTFITDDITELFDILDDHDIAVAPSLSQASVKGVPCPYQQYNTGVISYQSNKSVHKMFRQWNDIYQRWRDERGLVQNQPSFLRAVYESNTDLYTLPINYNARLFSPLAVHGDIKIVHGRPETGIENAAEIVNKSSRFRAVYRNSYISQSRAFKIVQDASLRYHLEKAICVRGIKQTMIQAPKYIKDRIL